MEGTGRRTEERENGVFFLVPLSWPQHFILPSRNILPTGQPFIHFHLSLGSSNTTLFLYLIRSGQKGQVPVPLNCLSLGASSFLVCSLNPELNSLAVISLRVGILVLFITLPATEEYLALRHSQEIPMLKAQFRIRQDYRMFTCVYCALDIRAIFKT